MNIVELIHHEKKTSEIGTYVECVHCRKMVRIEERDASAESFYITVNCPKFTEQTGRDYLANYELQLRES